MSSKNVSPGVYTKIIDLSEYVRNIPSTIGFLPIITEKGPDNQLIFTNARDFYYDFGEPNLAYAGKQFGQGPYVADSFLSNSDALYVVRCLPEDATYANLAIAVEKSDSLDVIGGDSTANTILESISDLDSEDALNTFMTNPSSYLASSDAASLDAAVLFYGVGRGEWYNTFGIDLSKPRNTLERSENPDIYFLDIYQEQADLDDDGNPRQEIVESFRVSFDPQKVDDSGDSMWIEDVLNNFSRYIRCIGNEVVCKTAIQNNVDFSENFTSGQITNIVEMDNGSSGSLFSGNAIDGSVAGQVLSKAYDGTLLKPNGNLLDEVLNTEDYYFNIVFDAGYPDSGSSFPDVKTKIYELVSTHRKDCIAIMDNGDNTKISNALSSRNANSFNSKYAAIYEPYTKVYDSWTGKNIWMTPVYHMARIIPYTDSVAEIWAAPAGFNRATIAGIKEMRFSPNLDERDQFYLNQINPIVKFNVGYTVYGQLTSQRRPTALQDINIVRLVLYIERALKEFVRFYIFESNNSETWSQINNAVNEFLRSIQDRRGLYSYSVSVGASEYDIKAKRCYVNITLNPTRVIEQIQLSFYIV